jgi:structural maintenance of chromosomes protein 6
MSLLLPHLGHANQSQNKRPRLSAEPRERSYSQDTESGHPENDDDAPSNSQNEDEDDNAEYIRATQIVQRTLGRNDQQRNVPAEAGIIQEIKCTNFMCHEQLTVTLGPLINFIIGHNGSGKSAVLTALTLCLGGKATATNRGQNLKSFIKEGRDFSILSVKIKNEGSTAYKPDQYGNSIIVERHFNRSGTSGFKLKDRNGKIVSTKKTELEDIIDAFAMQIDNPMNVLTQDMARQFLNDSNPKEKYKFFLKGTQLETLNMDYNQISQELEEQESRAQTLQGDVKIYRKKYEQAVAKAKSARNLENMRKKEQDLAHQAAWAQVEAEERELAGIKAQIDSIDDIIAARKVEADEQAERYATADEALNTATNNVQECEADIEPAKEEVKDLQAKWQDTKQKIFKFKVS